MPVATFTDLALDVGDPAAEAAFWSAALDRPWQYDRDLARLDLAGEPGHRLWFNPVPEPKTAKNRVHLDIYTRSLAELEAWGATVVLPEGDDRRWTVMADPDGAEFCAFVRDDLPEARVDGVVVDSADPLTLATWWHQVLGGDLDTHDGEWGTLENVPHFPILTFDFVPVSDPRTVKNRLHWDVVADASELVALGASMVRARDGGIRWDVLADPEGNEFCVFERD